MPGVPTSKNRLSRRQEQILFFIRESVESRGFPPSIREIGEAVGLSSSSTVHSHLRSLEAKGYLKRNPSKPRSIEILDGSSHRSRLIELPISKSSDQFISSTTSDSDQETMPLPVELAGGKESFLYTIERNYSQEAIISGDLVIVNRSSKALRGDMVLAQDASGVALKRLTSSPEDPSAILGRVIGVIRKLERS